MARLGIVVALASEAKALSPRPLPPQEIFAIAPGVDAVLSGIGPPAASRAAQRLADLGVSALAVFGVAGALSDRLLPGDLVCPAVVCDERRNAYATDAAWRERAVSGSGGRLLSVDRVLANAMEKSGMRERHAADAVDMESAAVAAVAKSRGLPLLVLRAISDGADCGIPVALTGGVDAYGRPRLMALMGGLLRQPAALLALPRLASGMSRALAALGALVDRTGPDLGWKT